VNGRAGVALGLFGSLREALKAVFQYEADRVHVFAVCSHPRDDVVVFREQVGRLVVADGRVECTLQRIKATWSTETEALIHRRLPVDSVPFTTSRRRHDIK
jgi:hypothetical protein